MRVTSKMSSEDRRRAIVKTARKVFIEKGFDKTTTRELAEMAGISEALLFKHFPRKEDLYTAIRMSCFNEEGAKICDRLKSLEPSTATLVFVIQDVISRLLGSLPEEGRRSFLRLVLRSLTEEGEFARLGIQKGPAHFVQKVTECVEAAKAAGDMVDGPIPINLGGWCIHLMISGFVMHSLPPDPVIDFGVTRNERMDQVIWFCLRGMGLKEEAIRRCYKPQDTSKLEGSKTC